MESQVREDLQAITNLLHASQRNVETLSLSRGMVGLRDKTSHLCEQFKNQPADGNINRLVSELESDLDMTAGDRDLLLSELERMKTAIASLAKKIEL